VLLKLEKLPIISSIRIATEIACCSVSCVYVIDFGICTAAMQIMKSSHHNLCEINQRERHLNKTIGKVIAAHKIPASLSSFERSGKGMPAHRPKLISAISVGVSKCLFKDNRTHTVLLSQCTIAYNAL